MCDLVTMLFDEVYTIFINFRPENQSKMITFNSLLKLRSEMLLSPQAYVRLYEKEKSAIQSAKFIPPTVGSNQISGHIQVKLKPGYATKQSIQQILGFR